MTKSVVAKSWSLHEWSDGTYRSWPEPEIPLWAAELAIDEWTELPSTNVISDVYPPDVGQYGNTGPDGVFNAYNGAALVPTLGAFGSMLFFGGGHQDYYGNEVYRLDLETLTYSRLTDPTDLESYAGPHTNGIYSDGNPSPAHTYYFTCVRGSEFLIGRRQVTNQPTTVNMISAFNTLNNTWTNSTQSPGIDPAQGDGMCYDPTRDLVWMVECDFLGWASWDPNEDEWTTYTEPSGALDPSSGPVYVPGKDCVLLFTGTSALRGLDPANPTSNAVSIITSGTAPTFSAGDMACWSSNLGAVVYYQDGGDSIYTLTPPAGDWKTGTWVWAQRSLTGTSGTHTGAGTYGKFQVIEWGEVTIAIVCGNPDASPYGVRLS